MKKLALFAFQGEPMCFMHVLLNALDLKEKGHEVRVVLEGSAVKLVPELMRAGSPLKGLFERVREAGLIGGVCRACSVKLEVIEEVERSGLPIADEMAGHASMSKYIDDGFEIITF